MNPSSKDELEMEREMIDIALKYKKFSESLNSPENHRLRM